MSNGPWHSKREDLLKHSRLALNASLPQTWDDTAIIERGAMLAEVFLRRWPRMEGGIATPQVHGPIEEPDADSGNITPEPSSSRTTTSSGNRTESSGVRRPSGAVPQHIIDVFEPYPVGTVLTVREIAAAGSSLYSPGEISPGAVNACLNGAGALGIRREEGVSPLSACKVDRGPNRRPADGHATDPTDLPARW